MQRLTSRLSPSLVISLIALFVALGGTGYAALSIGSKEIRNNSIASKDIKNGAIARADLSRRTRAQLRGATGRPGPAGPEGKQGPRGEPGAPGSAPPTMYRHVVAAGKGQLEGQTKVVAETSGDQRMDFGGPTDVELNALVRVTIYDGARLTCRAQYQSDAVGFGDWEDMSGITTREVGSATASNSLPMRTVPVRGYVRVTATERPYFFRVVCTGSDGASDVLNSEDASLSVTAHRL